MDIPFLDVLNLIFTVKALLGWHVYHNGLNWKTNTVQKAFHLVRGDWIGKGNGGLILLSGIVCRHTTCSWSMGPEKKFTGVEKSYREWKNESEDYVLLVGLHLLVKLGTATGKPVPWKKFPWYTENSEIKKSKIAGPWYCQTVFAVSEPVSYLDIYWNFVFCSSPCTQPN